MDEEVATILVVRRKLNTRCARSQSAPASRTSVTKRTQCGTVRTEVETFTEGASTEAKAARNIPGRGLV